MENCCKYSTRLVHAHTHLHGNAEGTARNNYWMGATTLKEILGKIIVPSSEWKIVVSIVHRRYSYKQLLDGNY